MRIRPEGLLLRWLEDRGCPRLARSKSEVDEAEVEKLKRRGRIAHPDYDDETLTAWAIYSVLTHNAAGRERKLARRRLWFWRLVLAGAVLVVGLLACVHAFGQTPHDPLLLEIRDEGTRVKVWPAGVARVNFVGSNVMCGWNPTTKVVDCSVTGGGAANWSNEEGPAGQINGVNVTFTLAHAPSPAASLQLVLNGQVLRSGAANDFSLSGSTITFNYPPPAGSSLLCWYQTAGTSWSNEEGPTGEINGANTTFTLAYAPSPPASLRLVLNGVTLRSGVANDFTISGNTISFNYPPTAGSGLIAWYEFL